MPKNPTKGHVQLNVEIPAELAERLRKAGEPVSKAVRQAIEAYLRKKSFRRNSPRE